MMDGKNFVNCADHDRVHSNLIADLKPKSRDCELTRIWSESAEGSKRVEIVFGEMLG